MVMVHSICKLLLLKFPLTSGHIAVTSFSSSLVWPTRRRALSFLSFNNATHAMSWKESRERVRGIMAIFSADFSTAATSADDKAIDGREYLKMSEEQLLRQCEMNTFKSSGPGGQHRNKRESAVRLKHRPTGIVAQAAEDRSQHMNRYRHLIDCELNWLLKGMQALLDLVFAVEGSVSEAAKRLGLSTGALSRLILSDDSLKMAVNEFRASKGMKPLK